MIRIVWTRTYRRMRADQVAARQMAGDLITARTCAERIRSALWRLSVEPIETSHFDAARERTDDLLMTLRDYGAAPQPQTYVYPPGHPLKEHVA